LNPDLATADHSFRPYLERLRRFTERIASMPSVTGVRSLADGPNDFEDASASPFWSRLLIAENRRSSNVIVFTPGNDPERLVRLIERAVGDFDRKDFHIRIAGAPYVVEMIRRSIGHDFIYFSLVAVALFGATMGWVFRSARLLAGMLATCTTAVLLTLLVQSFAGRPVGVLTTNLGIIVFVMALSSL